MKLFFVKYIKLAVFPLLVLVVGFNYHTDKQLIRVVVDAAHGGNDTGAVYDSLVEKSIVLNIVDELKKVNSDTIEFIFLRNTDVYIPTNQRLDFINNLQPDLVISLHLGNDGDATKKGIVAHINKNKVYENSQFYAQKLLASLRNVNPVTCTKINNSDFYYLEKLNQTPTIILELGYLSNIEDREFITTPSFKTSVANSLVATFN